MKVPLSWLGEFVEIEVSISELARRLTVAGLEVEEIRYVGLPFEGASVGPRQETRVSGLAWDPERIVVGEIREVMPHPNADRLVLTRLFDGEQEHTVLTGAPNLFGFKGTGPLERPLKVAYAKAGAEIYDGKQAGWEKMILKPAKIRGVESSSMACSEKELGISDDHEGIIFLDDDAVPGTPLASYMGDAVLDIAILPNIARAANILGVARELAALFAVPLKEPSFEVDWQGPAIEGRVKLEIREPELNPRFVLGLIEGVQIGPSPYWVQRRLRLAGMRPINNIVDATNYAMLEIGEPLHAFDYDILEQRAGGKPPTIITRLPEKGEALTTLDGMERRLDDFTILVADTAGALSIGGIMGGAASEVSVSTTRVLLEGAAWDFINIRRTAAAQGLSSEAAYRFERGVHPAMAERGVRRGLELMRRLSGGRPADGLVDAYPRPPKPVPVMVSPADTERWLGVRLSTQEIGQILGRLGFEVQLQGDPFLATGRSGETPRQPADSVRAIAPDHRLDIGAGVVGQADLMEELARVYGYDRIPETQIEDRIPPQHGNPELAAEERARDLLVGMGLQEVVTYRFSSPEREAAQTPGLQEAVQLVNPIAQDRSVLRTSLLAGLLEVVQRNDRVSDRLALFEIGPVFLPVEGSQLPDEPARLAIALRGPSREPGWLEPEPARMGFYDLKGVIDGLLEGLHLPTATYEPAEHPMYHPAMCAQVSLGGQRLGLAGEIHPGVAERWGLQTDSVTAAELDLGTILKEVPPRYPVHPAPAFPPVLEDLAFIVGADIAAERVRSLILEEGRPLVQEVRLFDRYRGDPIEEGKLSLAFSIIYQASERTLTDAEVAEARQRIVRRVSTELGARLREA
jgi:phenylalanyl-tRNA synthetase beta chain